MNKKGLTISMIFEASSANYGEGMGNISQLKKMTRSDGKVYTYISRQALRYNIVQQMGIDNTPVHGEQTVVQFASDTKIDKYPEIDLFGYMKTKKGKDGQEIRSAVARLSNAISLEPYKYDTDYLNNMGLAQRNNLKNALALSEIHKSLYAYTLTIDLDKVGIDKDIAISNDEKAERVVRLLETIEFLWRDIKGRRENFNPVFAVGGVYDRKNPYFESRLKLKNEKNQLDVDLISSVINSCNDTKENTVVGSLSGVFNNDSDIIEKLSPVSVNEMFAELTEKVRAYYA